MKLHNATFWLLASAAAVASAAAPAPSSPRTSIGDLAPTRVSTSQGGVDRVIPLQGWPVDVRAGIASLASASGRVAAKAATDAVTIFRPLRPCRLIDTRGTGPADPNGFRSAVNVGGVLDPAGTAERRPISAANLCGIPSLFVKGISASVITQNTTVNNGGYIALVANGAGVSGLTDVFNSGAVWSSTTYAIPTSSSTVFDIYVAQSTPNVIIDVNGYYQDLDYIDTVTEMDFAGGVSGDVLTITNLGDPNPSGTLCNPAGSCSALALNAQGTSTTSGPSPALTFFQGSLRVAGATVNSSTLAFIHQVNIPSATQCGAGNAYTTINHPMLNGDSTALMLFTPKVVTGAVGELAPSAGPFEAVYAPPGCTAARWTIHDKSGAAISGQFNVLVIKG